MTNISPQPDHAIWGLSAIARILGVSRDTARRLAELPDVPIYQPPGSGRYFARLAELKAWLKAKPPPTQEQQP